MLLATFQPPIPGVQYFDMCCRTLSGRVFKLEGKCDGLQPDVSLSHNVIMVSVFRCWSSERLSLLVMFSLPHLGYSSRVLSLPPRAC